MFSNLFTIEMIMALMITAVMVAVPTFLIYKIAERFPAAHPVAFFPEGVKGWLILFVATVVLSIILTIFNMIGLYAELSATDAVVNWALFMPHVAVIFLYVYMLTILTYRRTSAVVKQTIVILWVVGPISILFLKLFFDAELNTVLVTRSVFYATVWTLYFLFSKRVACTYGTASVNSFIKIALQMAAAKKKQEEAENKK